MNRPLLNDRLETLLMLGVAALSVALIGAGTWEMGHSYGTEFGAPAIAATAAPPSQQAARVAESADASIVTTPAL